MNRGLSLMTALLAAMAVSGTAAAAEDDILLEFHFQPVKNAQIAIWIEDADGKWVQDVMVTQATGTLGIGNRSGRPDFLSSWRFPYGPRPGVLPIWAHSRGKTYPALVFYDDNPADQDSLGWHENSSSPEPYFCRPLSDSENETIAYDTMTCPSPAVFQSDKGQFSEGVSYYPPRSDHTEIEEGHDSPDVLMFAEMNDLDAVSRATPRGNEPALFTTTVPRAFAEAGKLKAWIEINIEDDQNEDWLFDREADHWVDPRLSGFGIGWKGQPSIVYSVEFDAMKAGLTSTDMYSGYGDLMGETGDIHAPDSTISTTDGSGADRLQLFTKNDETFRFGVYSHGEDGPPDEPDDDGWGECRPRALPSMTGMELEPVDFDTVRVHFTVPELDDMTEVMNVRLYYRASEMPLSDETASQAIQQVPSVDDCGDDILPGATTWCDVDELFGSTLYQIGIVYEDSCSNASNIVAGEVVTPRQEFAVVDGFCFVATAAYGAPWAEKVQALRWARDRFLQSNELGAQLVDYYYYVSPSLASMIADSPVARGVARAALGPIADLAEAAAPPQYRE